ncbi:Uncharacterised protein [Corynebacterium kutscheri]|uniref:Uncharacterized protein n=1 Tax=Corynebacterium kutscheri TaxID=35755 RepID=A0A0F6TCD9_9CORY|nr:hypothetical protein [Corynebacterium kutscheri]AKE40716.1 hypothetical protein UL82_02455 [Corynebacterium kutscheri]VEH04644.1 Uncharacterised protein [Corynebacterium kutscheri]VEH11113.1 Uncharacterised protein [Corynebacterium kutscheri]VEH80409.1 Uncharacterised protein [Corynebacterium kutscheri]
MRIYIPATFDMLHELNERQVISARSGYAFAVTPALRDYYVEGDEDEIAYSAFEDAVLASIRLLAIGDEHFPYRRVVLSADVPDDQVTFAPELGESVVILEPAQVNFSDVASIHVDVADSEEATKSAIALIDQADLGEEGAELTVGDALDNYLAWYDPSELNILVQLM